MGQSNSTQSLALLPTPTELPVPVSVPVRAFQGRARFPGGFLRRTKTDQDRPNHRRVSPSPRPHSEVSPDGGSRSGRQQGGRAHRGPCRASSRTTSLQELCWSFGLPALSCARDRPCGGKSAAASSPLLRRAITRQFRGGGARRGGGGASGLTWTAETVQSPKV